MFLNLGLVFTKVKIQLTKIWKEGWNKTKRKNKSKIKGNHILLIIILDCKYKQFFSYNEQERFAYECLTPDFLLSDSSYKVNFIKRLISVLMKKNGHLEIWHRHLGTGSNIQI